MTKDTDMTDVPLAMSVETQEVEAFPITVHLKKVHNQLLKLAEDSDD